MAAARRVCSWLVSSMLATSASAMLAGARPPLPPPLLLLLVEALPLSPWLLHAATDRMHLNHTAHRARIEREGPNVHAWMAFFQMTKLHAISTPFCPHLAPLSPNPAMPMPGMATRGRAQADRLPCRLDIILPFPQNMTNSRTRGRDELTHPHTFATPGSTRARSRTFQSCMLPTIEL